MVLTTMTKRIFPLSGLGPLTKEYTLSSDYDDRWRTGGLEVPALASSSSSSSWSLRHLLKNMRCSPSLGLCLFVVVVACRTM